MAAAYHTRSTTRPQLSAVARTTFDAAAVLAVEVDTAALIAELERTPAAAALFATEDDAPPAKPSGLDDLPRYRAEIAPFLTATLAPNELQALVVTHGANKDGEGEVAQHSLRAAGAQMGVSYETIRLRAKRAEIKVAAAAERAGLDLDTAFELLGMASSHDLLDQPRAAGYENDCTVVLADDFEHDPLYGFERAEQMAHEDDEGQDEGCAVTDEIDALDHEAPGCGVALGVTDQDHAGRTLSEADKTAALEEWDAIDGGDLPQAYHVQWAKLCIAYHDGAMQPRAFWSAYARLSAEVQESASAAPLDQLKAEIEAILRARPARPRRTKPARVAKPVRARTEAVVTEAEVIAAIRAAGCNILAAV